MYFRILHDESSGAVSYLLGDLAAGEAVIVDPRGSDVALLKAMLGEHRLRLCWLLRTHEHDRLLPGEAEALGKLGAPCIQHDSPRHTLAQGMLAFGHENLQVLRTPGHTPGCLSFRWRDRVFCGGLLAVDSCPHQPRPALPEAMWDSVTRAIFSLPSETLLFTGQAPRARFVSTVLEQRRWHPWFGGLSRDAFLARLRELPPPPRPDTRRNQDPARLAPH